MTDRLNYTAVVSFILNTNLARSNEQRTKKTTTTNTCKITMARVSLAGRRVISRPNSSPGSNRRHGSSTHHHHEGSFVTRQTFLILGVGVLLGYILLPLILIEMHMDEVMNALPETIITNELPVSFGRKDRDATIDISAGSGPYLRPIDSDAMFKPSRSLDVVTVDASEIERRIVEDHEFLARQSVPTSITPWVMKTGKLPDHQRMKILVTGGAGFVGSHLVDKLMMEGHEVIVVDNFFTGRKGNIAHWLHHPNFRYV